MSIIKVNHLEGINIKKIFVFKGDHTISNDFRIDDESFLFSETEIKNINKNNIPVVLIDILLHEDDTVSTIKKKNNTTYKIKNFFKRIVYFRSSTKEN